MIGHLTWPARWSPVYSASLRELSTDPIGYEDQLNLYAYVHNDPINNIDPNGEISCTIVGWCGYINTETLMNQGQTLEQATQAQTDAFVDGVEAAAAVTGSGGLVGGAAKVTTKAPGIVGWVRSLFTKNKSPDIVIGKVDDLKAPGALRKNESTLSREGRLPDQGSPKANWKQNSGELRKEINKGKPIRDVSAHRSNKEVNGSFLGAERNLLRNKGWKLNPKTKKWEPPKRK